MSAPVGGKFEGRYEIQQFQDAQKFKQELEILSAAYRAKGSEEGACLYVTTKTEGGRKYYALAVGGSVRAAWELMSNKILKALGYHSADLPQRVETVFVESFEKFAQNYIGNNPIAGPREGGADFNRLSRHFNRLSRHIVAMKGEEKEVEAGPKSGWSWIKPENKKSPVDATTSAVARTALPEHLKTVRFHFGSSQAAALLQAEIPEAVPVPTPVPTIPLSGADTIAVKDARDQQVQGELQLTSGEHDIEILHSDRGHIRGAKEKLEMQYPVYRFSSAQFQGMWNPASCLVMHETDFDTIKEKIHTGAFGDYYVKLEGGMVAVWKIPADLKQIEGWKVGQDIIRDNVGHYPLKDDTASFSTDYKSPTQGKTENLWATKFRYDVPTTSSTVQAVHFLSDEEGKEPIPAFSTGNICVDFYEPTVGEKGKIDILLHALDGYGIKSFMCNGQHHVLVFYQTGDGQPMTGRALVDLLEGIEGDAIKAALKAASKEGVDVDVWVDALQRTVEQIEQNPS